MSQCCCAHQQRGDVTNPEGEMHWLMMFSPTDSEGQTCVYLLFSCALLEKVFIVNFTNKRL